MHLVLKDILELVSVDEETLMQWIKNDYIPHYKINHQYRFNKTEIKEWLLKNNIPFSKKINELLLSREPADIASLVQRGNIAYSVDGHNPVEIIKNAVNAIPSIPSINRNKIAFMLLEREEMQPTAIGNGIAIPHPRTPIIAYEEHESITICFLSQPVEFQAIDHKPVHTLFIVLSATLARHLEILARIASLCRKETFISLLKKRVPKEELISYITTQQKEWLR